VGRQTLLVPVLLVGLAGSAAAATPAEEHARRSTTLTLSTELSPLPSVAVRSELGGALRVIRRRVAVEGRVGFALAATTLGSGWIGGVHAGLAAGTSVPILGRLAVTPMLAYDVYSLWQNDDASAFVVQRVSLALPLTWTIYPHVVLEGVVEVGFAFVEDSSEFALVVGPRIGIVF
jgi:hypothetical protein